MSSNNRYPFKKVSFFNAPFDTEFLGYGGEPTSLLYAMAPLIDSIKNGSFPELSINDIALFNFRSSCEIQPESLFQATKQNPPSILGISNMTPSSLNAKTIASSVKKASPGTITIFGGPHEDEMMEGTFSTANVSQGATALTNPQIVDFSISGDGEYALEFLIKEILPRQRKSILAIKEHVASIKERIRRIPGHGQISFRLGNEVILCPLSENPLDLNSIPPLPRELLQDSHARNFSIFKSYGRKMKTAQIITRRGCSWRCSFCTEGTPLIERSFESVQKEIEHAKSLNYEAIFFDDSTFTDIRSGATKSGKEGASRRKFNSILFDYLRKEKWHWGCETRVDQVSEEVLKELKDAGCRYIYFGVESVNDPLLRDMHKGQSKFGITSALDLIDRFGIRIGLSLMFCAPNSRTNKTVETDNTIVETMDFLKKRVLRGNIAIISTNIATFYPGSQITKQAKDAGLQLDFDNPTPNRGFPWNRFEDGQGFHPENVTADFAEEIVEQSVNKLGPYLLKGNVSAFLDDRFKEYGTGKESFINLNFPEDQNGSFGRKHSIACFDIFAEKKTILKNKYKIFNTSRKIVGELCGIDASESMSRIALTRTPPEAISLALHSLNFGNSANPEVSALIAGVESVPMVRSFTFWGDHGNPKGKDIWLPFHFLPEDFDYPENLFPNKPTNFNIECLQVPQKCAQDEIEDHLLGMLHQRIIRNYESTTIILIPHILPETGLILDVERICSELRRVDENLIIIVDGQFGAGMIGPDWKLDSVDCDYYISSPSMAFCLPGLAALVLGKRNKNRFSSLVNVNSRVPILSGMFAEELSISPNVKDSLPARNWRALEELVKNIGKNKGTHGLIEIFLNHRLLLNQYFQKLFQSNISEAVFPNSQDNFAPFIASFRLPGIDQFELVERIWRENKLLTAYFCRYDVIRVAFDLSNNTDQIDQVVQILSNCCSQINLRGDILARSKT